MIFYEEENKMPKTVKTNEHGRRIGQSHPRATLTDHEVGLLFDFLSERDEMIAEMRLSGSTSGMIDIALAKAGLSFRCLATKFDVHKQTIAKIASGERRCQTPA